MGDNFGTVGMGALGGAGAGAAIGSAIPVIGTAVGAGIGAILGGIGAAQNTKAQTAGLDRLENIPTFDPMQLNFLDQLKREKRSLDSGFTTDFQVAKDLNKEMLASGLSVAESVASTNPALALSLTSQASKGFTTGINQALGTISTRSLGYTSAIGELINKISQRKLDLDVLKTNQQIGIATDRLRTSNINAAQFAARLPQYADDFGKIPGQLSDLFGVGRTGNSGFGGSGFGNAVQNLGAGQVAPALSLPF